MCTLETNKYVNNVIRDKSIADFNVPKLAHCILSSEAIYRQA